MTWIREVTPKYEYPEIGEKWSGGQIKSKPHLKGEVLFLCLLAVGLPRGGFPLGKGTATYPELVRSIYREKGVHTTIYRG